VAFIAHM